MKRVQLNAFSSSFSVVFKGTGLGILMLLVYASYSQGQIAEACYSFLRATSYLRSIIGEEYCEDSSSL